MREPLATVVVSQFQVTVERLLTIAVCCAPSTKIVNRLLLPLAPDTAICTGTVPCTVWPGVRFGKLTVSVPGGAALLTRTERVAVAVAPLASRTVRARVCGPSPDRLVFHEYVAVVAAVVVENTDVPSIVRVKVFDVPVAPLAAMPTATVPLTVAPSGGLVNAAVSAALCTVMMRDGGLGSLAPASSVTVSETWYTPGSLKVTAPGVGLVLVAGVPPGKIQR